MKRKSFLPVFTLRRTVAALLTAVMIVSLAQPTVCQKVSGEQTESIMQQTFDDAAGIEQFDLYSTSAGGFAVVDGKLTPIGDAGEFKAIYNASSQPVSSVSVEMHPNGNDGMFGGLYIAASNAAAGQDAIDAYYVGIESNFTGWEDAPNRLDITLGKFNQSWVGEQGARVISETGNNNALFTDGNKQPVCVRAVISGDVLTVTVSLVSNPVKQVSAVYTLDASVDLSIGAVGIRSHYSNAMYDNFTVEYAEEDMASATIGFDNTDAFTLYSNTAGGFAAQNGKLTPAGDAGEFKAIYNQTGRVRSVSVELHPHGNDGPIYGGLYIGASDAANEQDAINALYLGVESHFPREGDEAWEDAPNRVDLIIGQFGLETGWTEYSRTVSETGLGNALFAGGIKEPLTLRADISGSMVVVTVSLVRDPGVYISVTYTADSDLSTGQVGIRSNFNDATYDNFSVNAITAASAAFVGFENADAFDLYSANSAGSFITVDGKLVPAGEATELKAIYKSAGQSIRSVSVELHPVGDDGPIYGGLYIGASDAANEQDAINALYLGVESHFPREGDEAWEDAPNRVDLIIGQFGLETGWTEHSRTVSETGLDNNLFTGGVKEPLVLRADISGNTVIATVSLKSDPSKYISATYTADYDLSIGQVGIRSHYNNAVYDNFAVNAVAVADGIGYGTVSQAVCKAGSSVITLLGNTDEVVTVTGDTTVDLAGHSLSNVFTKTGSSLKLVDTTADDFATGSGWAKVAGDVEAFAFADGKQYLAVADEDVWTSHRYDVAITHITLDPAKDALGYKAKLYGDETVSQHLTGIGFNLWVEDGRVKTLTTAGKQQVTLRLKDILKCEGGEKNIHATAFVTLTAGADSYTHTGARQTTTMKQTLQTVDSMWMTYTQEQADAVLALCKQYQQTTSGWGLDNIFCEGVNFAQPLDRGEQQIVFTATETYVNGRDIEGQWGVGEYTADGDYGIGDPFVMRYNGKYYMYPSSNGAENDVSGIKVFTSEDLVNWTYEGFAVEDALVGYAYAPEVLYYNGTFYLCTSPGGNGHYIYKSDSPLGPFERLTDNFGYSIDGSMWVDDDGNLFFLHPKRASGQANGIYISALDPDTMLPGDDTALPSSMPGYEDVSTWVEGPGLFRRGAFLYLTYSGNRVTEDTYRVGYSYSLGSDPEGTFVQPEDYILLQKSGPDNFRGLGHNSNVIGPDLDSWYAAYHNLVNKNGPQRRYMLDKLVTNGSVVMANGPTYWQVSAPERPDFETRDAAAGEGLWLSGAASEAVFTAEFNFTPAQAGITRFVFSYVDESNYCQLLWDDSAKTLTVTAVTGGEAVTLGTATVDFLLAEVLHTVRIEQGASRLMVYLDTMRKLDVTHPGVAGMIGAEGDAQFGYIAFSNDAFGTSDFDTVKIVEGQFPAVHYLKGEDRGFSIANAQMKEEGIRQGEKESTVYDAETCSYALLMDTPGDWVKYAIDVSTEGLYDLSASVAAICAGAQLQVIVDGQIYEMTVPAFEDDAQTAQQLLGQLELAAGKHTLKLRLREGTLQAESFALTYHQEVSE